jgi:hypothetical protein
MQVCRKCGKKGHRSNRCEAVPGDAAEADAAAAAEADAHAASEEAEEADAAEADGAAADADADASLHRRRRRISDDDGAAADDNGAAADEADAAAADADAAAADEADATATNEADAADADAAAEADGAFDEPQSMKWKSRTGTSRLSSEFAAEQVIQLSKYNDVQPRLTVRASSIAGLGLFALTDIAKGTYLTEYDGERKSRCDLGNVHPQTHVAECEGVYVNGLRVPIHGRGMGSFANHSTQPNCRKLLVGAKVVLVATKQISSADEVTMNYGSKGSDAYKLAMGEAR